MGCGDGETLNIKCERSMRIEEYGGAGVATVWGGRGGVQAHNPTTSWPTHPPDLHHKPTGRVAVFVVNLWWPRGNPARAWLQVVAAMVRAKCGGLPHFDHTAPHTHHKVWRKCGGTESIGDP